MTRKLPKKQVLRPKIRVVNYKLNGEVCNEYGMGKPNKEATIEDATELVIGLKAHAIANNYDNEGVRACFIPRVEIKVDGSWIDYEMNKMIDIMSELGGI